LGFPTLENIDETAASGFTSSEQMPCLQARCGHFDYAISANRML
jgi:hypothetical protein